MSLALAVTLLAASAVSASPAPAPSLTPDPPAAYYLLASTPSTLEAMSYSGVSSGVFTLQSGITPVEYIFDGDLGLVEEDDTTQAVYFDPVNDYYELKVGTATTGALTTFKFNLTNPLTPGLTVVDPTSGDAVGDFAACTTSSGSSYSIYYPATAAVDATCETSQLKFQLAATASKN